MGPLQARFPFPSVLGRATEDLGPFLVQAMRPKTGKDHIPALQRELEAPSDLPLADLRSGYICRYHGDRASSSSYRMLLSIRYGYMGTICEGD